MRGIKNNIGKYAFEFLSIFIAVVAAFALNNWNDNRRDRYAEEKILLEIKHGLDKDLEDININIMGHNFGLRTCQFWQDIANEIPVNKDTLVGYYFTLTRDFISEQNISGYENLKSRGLELIANDSLRSHIIALYEYDYNALKNLEERYYEMQFQANYFQALNNYIAPALQFDDKGDIVGINLPLELSAEEKNLFLSYLWKIKSNRHFILDYYQKVMTKVNVLKQQIDQELMVL